MTARAIGRVANAPLADGVDSPQSRYLAARSANSVDGIIERLDCHRHMEGIGVYERFAVTRECDMPFPEYEVASLQIGKGG